MSDTISELETRVARAMGALADASDPAKTDAELRAELEPLASDRALKASRTLRLAAEQEVLTAVAERQAARRVEAERELHRVCDEDESIVLASVAACRVAPTPRQVWYRRNGGRDLSLYDEAVVGQLELSVQGQLERSLPTLSPSKVLEAYRGAQRLPDGLVESAVIAWVERQCGDGSWPGAKSTSQTEVQALQQLKREMEAAKDGRVDLRLRELQGRYASARRTLAARAARRVDPRVPAREKD